MLKSKKLLSLMVTALFVLSTAVPTGKISIVSAKSSDGKNAISYLESSKDEIASKVSKSLNDQFKTDDTKVTFLVKLKDQVDTTKVSKEAETKARKQGLTSYMTALMERSSIVSELTIKADDTQSSIKTYLDSQVKKGNVTKYKSFYIVNGLSVTGSKAVMNDLAAMPEVQSISPNVTISLVDNESSTPTATITNKATTATDNNIEPNIIQIGANQAWQLGVTGTGVTVGSLDTGVQWNHPALQRKYRGYNPSNPDTPDNQYNFFDAVNGQSTPYDDNGHGTHTMGTMVGSCADGTNQIGVAPGANWISAKILGGDGTGTSEQIIAAGQWMLAPTDSQGNHHPEKAPDIVNNSWGAQTNEMDDWFREVVTNWRNAGILPEFSAGNVNDHNPGGPGSVATPGSYPESFTTGAVDANNNLASFSLRGPSPYGGVLKPEISAPGVNIRSSVPSNGYNGTYSGTSMAGPHICGTAALLKSVNHSLTVDQIETIIKNTATARTDSQYPTSPNNGYGYGVVNAYLAVTSIMGGIGQIKGYVTKTGNDTVPPSITDSNPTTSTHEGFDTFATVTANDDVSIKTVEIQYKHSSDTAWGSAAATQTSGDYKGGDYTAQIPGAQVTGTSIQYRWRVVDYGNHEIFSNIHNVTISSTITDGYFTDFETQPANWTTSGTSNWEWGVPTGGPGVAASGQKVYATKLAGAYDSNTNTVLEMPAIHLQAGNSYLQFKQWYDVENSYDKCFVNVSTDHTNWTTLAIYTGASGSNYINTQVDLSAYTGKGIYIRFVMTSDNSINKQGWFIDDVRLSNQSALSTDTNTSKAAEDSTKTNKIKTASNIGISSIPLSATVTVTQNGASVNTNPADGSYTLRQAVGDYTLRAETYGFYPKDIQTHVTKDAVTDNVNFNLDPIPKGTIAGKVTNLQTGAPIANAKIYLIEDAAVAPVFTDNQGNYSINAYEGTYTVQIMAESYYSERFTTTVTGNQTTTHDVQMRPFIGYDGQIGYDDGSAEDAIAYNVANCGWAVKMTLPEGKNSAMLAAGLFKFWDTSWPVPGATNYKVAVYDATGKDGTPGNLLAGPYDATATRDKNVWSVADLSGYGITVPHDFFVAYIQVGLNPNCPGLAIDVNGTPANRTYQLSNGAWSKYSGTQCNNIMIRAAVKYEAQAPVITSPQNNLFTSKENLTVTGTATSNLDVHVFNNNTDIATVRPDDNGNFSAKITLAEGANKIKAYTTSQIGHTDYSNEVNIVLDTTAPELDVTSPADKLKTNKEAITVQGTIVETNLESILVNGIKAKVNEDGTWSARIVLNEGMNDIETVATDKAGNVTTKIIKVDAKYSIREITNLMPNQDIRLNAGKSAKVEFDSEPGLKEATFTIHAPLFNDAAELTSNDATFKGDIEIPMTEVMDSDGNGTGHYVGYWTATSKLVANGAQIEVKLADWYGNTLTKYANGKLNINVPLDITFNNFYEGMKVNNGGLEVTGKLGYSVKQLIINGVVATVKDDLTFSANISLPYVTNNVTVKAIDFDDTVLSNYAIKVYCDTVPPTVSFVSPVVDNDGNVYTNKDSITVKGTVYDNTFGYKFYINGELKMEVNLPDIGGSDATKKDFEFEVPVTNGCKVEIKVVDQCGNEAPVKVYNVVVDKVNPIISITGVEDGKAYNTEVTPLVATNEGNLTVTLNGKPYNGEAVKDEGKYQLKAVSVDKAGNTSEMTVNFVIDKTNPVITIAGVENGKYYNTNITPKVAANEGTLTMTLNDKPYNGEEIKDEGKYELRATAVDAAGNTSEMTVSFTIDKTNPEITVTGVEDGKTYTSAVEPIIKCSEGTLTMTLDSKEYKGENITKAGDHELIITAVDLAGNTTNKVIKFNIASPKIVQTGSIANTNSLLSVGILFMAAGTMFVFGRKRVRR